MNPFQQFFEMLLQRQADQQRPVDWRSVSPTFAAPRPGLPPTPYRDPMQAGPEPPVSSPFTRSMGNERMR